MSKEFQIRDGNLIASFDLENEDGDIDFCKLLKVSHGVANEIGMFVDYIATNKIIGDQSKEIADLEAKLAECEEEHELLIDQFEEETEKLRKQIKQESDARKRFVEEVKELKQQLAITEKALELACERVKYFEEMQDKEMGFYEFFGYDSDYDLKAIIEQYKQQAKEMGKNA